MSSYSANPFKGLQPYSRADRERLFGRDRDLILMKDRIFSARTTLLFAGSGVGKTSFLNAKIIPELETQYCIFYHNRWAGPAKPLDAVKATLAEKIERANQDGTLLDIFQQFKKTIVPPTAELLGDADGIPPTAQCLLIFDQFEEIFQYHSYEDYFKRFLNELCDVIKIDEYRVHVVFSMREEFLGELSVFDNIIPDLFNNYYRLKYPDTREARQIIEGTCSLADARVHKDGLKQLIGDLSKIEKGAAGAAERSTGAGKVAEHIVERDFIIPPYLQIVCHRQWQNQTAKLLQTEKESFDFLADYQPNQAQKILNDFCQEKLSALSFMEQNLAADSFDFLVTKQGAKMAYEFTSLAEHMRIRFFKQTLKRALDKLSDVETRILRKSHGPDGSIWFELYHDIYGKILDTWRQSFRQRKRRLAIGVGIPTLLLLLSFIPITWHWLVYPKAYKTTLQNAHLENPEEYASANEAYMYLSETSGYGSSANALWAQAWERRAHYAESHNKREEAVISWLKALSLEPTGADSDRRRRKIGNLVEGGYRMLRGSLHHENDINDVVFSDDGRVIVTKTDDQKLWIWSGSTGEQIGKYSEASRTESAATEQNSSAPGSTATNGQGRPREKGAQGSVNAPREGTRHEKVNYESQEYSVLAAALHPELGWLVAVTLKDVRSEERIRSDRAKKRESPLLKISILSNGLELLNSPLVMDVTGGSHESERGVVFSPDGKYLVAIGVPHSPRIWKLADRKFVPIESPGNLGVLKEATFSSDSKSLLLYPNERKQLFMWDMDSQKLRYEPISVDKTTAFAFSPDGKRFGAVSLSALKQTQIKMWNTGTGKPEGRLISPDLEPTFRMALDNDGKAKLFDSDTVQIVDILTGDVQKEFQVSHNKDYREVSISPNANVGVAYKGKEAELFNVEREEPPQRALTLNQEIVTAMLIEEGRKIVTLSNPEGSSSTYSEVSKTGETVQVWDAQNSLPLGEPIDNVLALSLDGKYAARQAKAKDLIQIIDVQSGTELRRLARGNPRDSQSVAALTSSPSGKFFGIFYMRPDYVTYLRDYERRNEPFPVSGPVDIWGPDAEAEPFFHRDPMRFTRPVFSPDERFLAISDQRESNLIVLDLVTRQQILSNKFSVEALAFNKQGLLIAGGGKVVRVWDPTSGKRLYNDLETNTNYRVVALSPDGQLALTGDVNGTESLWKFFTSGLAKRVGSELGHGATIWSAEFSADGKTAIIIPGDWLHIINVENNEHLTSYFLGNNWLHRCASVDGTSSHLRCLFQQGGKLVYVKDLQAGEIAGNSPISGDPNELLEVWQGRLGRKINNVGQIVPTGVEGAIFSTSR